VITGESSGSLTLKSDLRQQRLPFRGMETFQLLKIFLLVGPKPASPASQEQHFVMFICPLWQIMVLDLHIYI
jgi:hypothetical protein